MVTISHCCYVLLLVVTIALLLKLSKLDTCQSCRGP